MKARRLPMLLVIAFLLPVGVAHAGGETLDADVIKRGRARPEGTRNIGVYVQTRREYRDQWDRFGFRSERPGVNFDRRRVVFVATTESSSCPFRFRRVALRREEKRLVVHLSNASSGPDCTDDIAPRSFVISVERKPLPRGELDVRIRRHS